MPQSAAPARKKRRAAGTPAAVSASPAAPHTEIELKLSCPPENIESVAGSAAIARYARDGGTDVDLTATYYDTPGLDLRQAGGALRVRSDGVRSVMTLKLGEEGGGVLERKEFETDVAAMAPDVAALAGWLPEAVYAQVRQSGLVPMFSTRVRRHVRLLDVPGGVVELAVDRGRIEAGERSEEVSEIELELVAGDVSAILHLARELAADFPLRPSLRSKSARGFDLALGSPPAVSKAAEPALPPGASLDQALGTYLGSVLGHLLANQPAAEDGRSPEGLHQYRVALRRLVSLLRMVGGVSPSAQLDAYRDEAKRLIGALNEARDWDAFTTQVLPGVPRKPQSLAGHAALVELCEARRREAQGRARMAITDPRTGRLQIGLGLWLQQEGWRKDAGDGAFLEPARDYASTALRALHRKALRRGAHLSKLPAAERHRLRILLKRLRYTADFFLPLFGESRKAQRYATILARLQEELGRQNDLVVAERLLRRLAGERTGEPARASASAVLEWLGTDAVRDDKRLLKVWKTFRHVDPP